MEPDSSQRVASTADRRRLPEATDEEIADIIAPPEEPLERRPEPECRPASEATDEEIAHLFAE